MDATFSEAEAAVTSDTAFDMASLDTTHTPSQIPSDNDWLRGATELDIRLSPVLQDRIAQSCLIKIQQASSGRESLERLARLSSFWRRLQTDMLLMPMISAPQVSAPLDQWFTEFTSSTDSSTSLLPGLSTDFNWNLDLLVSSPSPSPNGLMGYELGSLWNMMDPQDFAVSVANNNFNIPLVSTSPSMLPSTPSIPSIDQNLEVPPTPDSMSLPQTVVQNSGMDITQAGPVVTSVPVSLQSSSDSPAWSNEVPEDIKTETSIPADIIQEPSQKINSESSEVMSMDVDIPMEDMSLSSPPPSGSPMKTRSSKRPANNQRRAPTPRKTRRSIRRQCKKYNKDSSPTKGRLASTFEESDEFDDEDLEHLERNKRRRGSKDSSSSSDSGSESAPGSPQTPPSTFDGMNTNAASSERPHSQNGDLNGSLFTAAYQGPTPNDTKASHMSPTVAVEDLVNLKRLEEEESHMSYQHRPSTRAFS
ncbi:hypothetical protein BGZ76_009305, partial [Entomortierella beljakovae]